MARQPLGGLGLLFEVPRSHSDTPHLVGFLWTNDRPVAETATWQRQHSHEIDIRAPDRTRTLNPSKRTAVDPRLRRRGHWDRHNKLLAIKNFVTKHFGHRTC